MNRDKLYRAYVKMLMEAEKWWKDVDDHFDQVNKLAHLGSSVNEIHDELESRMGAGYHAMAIQNWYKHGGEAPNNQYLRKLAYVALGKPSNVRHPAIEGLPVHDNMIHPKMVKWFHEFPHAMTMEAMKDKPNHLVVYRGVGLPSDHGRYIPHSLESWTTHQSSAELFSTKSHIEGVEPRVYRGVIHKNDVFVSHFGGIPIIPHENSIQGKEEHIVFGHALTNIERIK